MGWEPGKINPAQLIHPDPCSLWRPPLCLRQQDLLPCGDCGLRGAVRALPMPGMTVPEPSLPPQPARVGCS